MENENQCPLVLIKWKDSTQPIPSWQYLENFTPESVIHCVSVGWLIQDDSKVKTLAPNMGDTLQENSLQISGVISIPTSCVIEIIELEESNTIFSSDLSSHLEITQKPSVS